ncbi:glycerate kinase family protein [Bacillus sp. AK031]
MKLLIAPDSFKESMTAEEVCEYIERGFRKLFPEIHTDKLPIADGGEGTVRSLVSGTNGEFVTLSVTGPLGTSVKGTYGRLGDGETAVIEMAAASGLHYVPIGDRNPMITTSYGTGELIKHAVTKGARKIILGLGGSSTNDGGAGMAAALGAVFLKGNGDSFIPVGGTLGDIDSISLLKIKELLRGIEFEIACDVDNPLTGPDGASKVFGPQKGATPEMIKVLDNNLNHYGQKLSEESGLEVRSFPGSGAAGGMGAGAKGFLKGNFRPGAEIVLEAVHFKKAVIDADIVITGEGRMDAQTVHGKAPIAVARCAKHFNKPVIAITGSIGPGYEKVYEEGITSVFGIVPGAVTLEEALLNAKENIERTAENIARLLSNEWIRK